MFINFLFMVWRTGNIIFRLHKIGSEVTESQNANCHCKLLYVTLINFCSDC